MSSVHISNLNGKLEKFRAISVNTLSNKFCQKMHNVKPEKELRESLEENKILRKKVLDLQGELGSSYAKIKEIAGIIYAEKIKKSS